MGKSDKRLNVSCSVTKSTQNKHITRKVKLEMLKYFLPVNIEPAV